MTAPKTVHISLLHVSSTLNSVSCTHTHIFTYIIRAARVFRWHLDFYCHYLLPYFNPCIACQFIVWKKKMTQKSRKINKTKLTKSNVSVLIGMVEHTHNDWHAIGVVWQLAWIQCPMPMTICTLIRYKAVSMTLLYLCWCHFRWFLLVFFFISLSLSLWWHPLTFIHISVNFFLLFFAFFWIRLLLNYAWSLCCMLFISTKREQPHKK